MHEDSKTTIDSGFIAEHHGDKSTYAEKITAVYKLLEEKVGEKVAQGFINDVSIRSAEHTNYSNAPIDSNRVVAQILDYLKITSDDGAVIETRLKEMLHAEVFTQFFNSEKQGKDGQMGWGFTSFFVDSEKSHLDNRKKKRSSLEGLRRLPDENLISIAENALSYANHICDDIDYIDPNTSSSEVPLKTQLEAFTNLDVKYSQMKETLVYMLEKSDRFLEGRDEEIKAKVREALTMTLGIILAKKEMLDKKSLVINKRADNSLGFDQTIRPTRNDVVGIFDDTYF